MTDTRTERAQHTGKVAIVTGGGSGIGEGLCRELARRGTRVVIADIIEGNAGQVAAAIAGGGGQAESRIADIAREQNVKCLVEDTAVACGRLDYLFSSAGIGLGGDARDLTLGHWHQVLDVDLYSVLHGVLAAYPVMARQGFGHIVNISSAAAFFPDPGNAPYCTAKHAIVGLSLSLRLEGADLGVKISCVCPGFVRTNIYHNATVVNMNLPADGSGQARRDRSTCSTKRHRPLRIASVSNRTAQATGPLLGATRGQIRTQFLAGVILLSLAGGAAGVIIGAITTAAYARGHGETTVIPPQAWAGGLAAAVIIGALAGLLPAIRAARLSPTRALWTV
jgi:NAD(P)-dependent dehydrogenase (short-subunit alcohol dehydrogenase family)